MGESLGIVKDTSDPRAGEGRVLGDALVVEDRASLRTMLRRTLVAQGYRVAEAADLSAALAALKRQRFTVVLTDLKLGSTSGMDVLEKARELDPSLPVIVMTAFGTVEDAVQAMKLGAFDFLSKPVDNDHLVVLLERAVEQRRLQTENLILREEFERRLGFPEIIGDDPALKEISLALQRAAATDATVLLLGESGTGKELFARALHELSDRREGPFVAINCAAIPETLLENELFGHEKGAFTGAISRKLGKFELGASGTVFLDEIGEMPLALQSKLLRVLQEKNFERVGGTQTVAVDIRVVAATNRALKKAAEQGLFRDDLFFRLSVFPVEIPPLRERLGDIPALARHFVDRFCRELNKKPLILGEDCLEVLASYSWPGNVRELANCLERAVILSDGDEITRQAIHGMQGYGASSKPVEPADGFDLKGSLGQVSRRAAAKAEALKIKQVLDAADGDRSTAAEVLQVSGKTLLSKMRDYGFIDEASGSRNE